VLIEVVDVDGKSNWLNPRFIVQAVIDDDDKNLTWVRVASSAGSFVITTKEPLDSLTARINAMTHGLSLDVDADGAREMAREIGRAPRSEGT
jgi:hypothetical protein